MLLPNFKNQKGLALRNTKGFTLVELLTVISIISILTALLTVSFASVSQRGRDGQRKSNVRQIQAALELYRADNDSYPSVSVLNAVTCGGAFSTGASTSTITYMQKFPCDPKTGARYYYMTTPSATCSPTGTPCTGYSLVTCIDNSGDKESTTTKPFTAMTDCSPARYFEVKNP